MSSSSSKKAKALKPVFEVAGKPAVVPTGSSTSTAPAPATLSSSQSTVASSDSKKGKSPKKAKTARGSTPPSSRRGEKSTERATGNAITSGFAHSAAQAHEVVAAKPPLVRADFEMSSDEVGKLPTGSTVYVLEMRTQPDGAKRARVALEGQEQPFGWLTAVTKDGVENLRKRPLPVYEVTASKPPLARAGFELNSEKVGGADLVAGTLVHVLETRDTSDGARRALIALQGKQSPHGWITLVTKDGVHNMRESVGGRGASDARAEAGASVAESSSQWASGAGSRLALPVSVVAAKPALLRSAVETSSDKVGELARGSKVLLLEMRAQPDGAKRAQVALEGQTQPHGWLTAVTKDGVENLRPVVHVVSATKPPLVRIAADTTSEKVGELATGTRVHALERRFMPDGSQRACIILERSIDAHMQQQQQQAYGWLTSISKEGVASLKLVDDSAPLVSASAPRTPKASTPASAAAALGSTTHWKVAKTSRGKPMSADDAAAAEVRAAARKAAKAEQRALEEMVKYQKEAEKKAKTLAVKEEEKRRMDAIRQDKEKAANDARERAQRRKEEELQAAKDAERQRAERALREAKAARAAVEAKKGQRGGGPHVAIATAEDLASRFKAINAQSHASFDPAAKAAFKAMQDSGKLVTDVEPVKRNEAHRPHGRPDGMLSRHTDVPPVSMILMFNCYRSEYKVVMGDISSMPDAEDVPIKALESLVTIGRVKISPDKGTAFMDRIEFPNQWFIGDEHGLVHDGLQGDGYIELRLDWKVTNPDTQSVSAHCALVRVNPWLSYACSEGARLAMRRPDQTEGRCATVQRVLRDDSVVVRVDGMVGETTVDPSPLTVVRTTSPRHEPGTRLLFLNENICVDAVVEPWLEGEMDVKDGSRHRLRAAAATVSGWISCVGGGKDGEPERDNLRPTDMPGLEEGDAANEEGEATQYYSIIAPRPMLVRAGCEKDSGFVGHLNPGVMVRVLEFRDASDGTKRAFVDSLPGEEQIIVAALNEFNHSVQRFATAAEYEAARANYCEDMVEREAMVEDAITGNLLRIKDQTLHVSTATDGLDNSTVPAEWRVNDVRDLVTLFLIPSPNRSMGSHSAQPVLVRAGPGTGKTWMTKQAVFTLGDSLRVASGAKDGVRLLPMVVYVQRIVYLLRENSNGESTHLLSRYIGSVYSGRKYDSWREMLMQAYEMRALIVLLDGVDEAAGLKDDIEAFVHKELVPSGVRVLVTSRPEGVSVSVYAARFVVMNLCELTNEQQRRVINVQMQGSQFFDHLLSLGEARKGLDDAFLKLKESTRIELENLFVANRFKSEIDGSWLEGERQAVITGERFAKAREEERCTPGSLYLQQLDRELRSFRPQRCGIDLLAREDAVLRQSTFLTPDVEFQEKVLEDMLGPSEELEVRHKVAVKLGLMMQKRRHTASLAQTKEKEKEKMAAAASLSAENVWERVVARTDEIYVAAEQMHSIFEHILAQFVEHAAESEDGSKVAAEVQVADLKDPVRVFEKGDEFSSRFADDVIGEACVTDVLRARIIASTGSTVLETVNALIEGIEVEIEPHMFPMWRHERSKMTKDLVAKREAAQTEAGEGTDAGGAEGGATRDSSALPLRAAVAKSAAAPLEPVWKRGKAESIEMDKQLMKELGLHLPGVPVPNDVAQLEVRSMFNKFADLDPTHFRCVICTMLLTYRGVSIFCEVEIHYQEIMRIALGGGEVVQAMEHYNFFRRRLAGQVAEADLDVLLEGKLVFLVDATGIPVLLSLLVLIFTSGGEDLTKLPSNRIELYAWPATPNHALQPWPCPWLPHDR